MMRRAARGRHGDRDGNHRPARRLEHGERRRNRPLELEVVGVDPNVDDVPFTGDTADVARGLCPDGQRRRRGGRRAASLLLHPPRPPPAGRCEGAARHRCRGDRRGGAGPRRDRRAGAGGRAAGADAPAAPRRSAALPSPGRASMGGTEAKALLAAGDLTRTPDRLIADAARIDVAMEESGSPMVLKVVSDDIVHRSDRNLVRTGIDCADMLRAERGRMLDVMSAPAACAEQMESAQAGPGVEALVGAFADPAPGSCLPLGPGAVLVELIEDAAIRPLPPCEGDLTDLIDETRLGALVACQRGPPRTDRAALAARPPRRDDRPGAVPADEAADGRDAGAGGRPARTGRKLEGEARSWSTSSAPTCGASAS